MDQDQLNQRCVELFQHPRVKNMMWHPRMFWNIESQLSTKPEAWTKPKVDLCELEVLLSAAAYEESQCAADLDSREQGRAGFIRRAMQSGQRPLLKVA